MLVPRRCCPPERRRGDEVDEDDRWPDDPVLRRNRTSVAIRVGAVAVGLSALIWVLILSQFLR